MKRRILSTMMIFILTMALPSQVGATSIDDVKNQKAETQNNLDELNGKIDDISDQKDAVSSEITVLDSELVDILTSISICEDEIAAKEQEIEQAKTELAAAEKKEQTQYENMKKRIKFMYEKGDQAYLQIFLEASSVPEMLNKASYVEKLYEYDRNLLTEYEETKQQIADLKEELELEEADLLTSQNELKDQKAYLENTIATKKATVANFDSQLAAAKKEAKNYKQQLEEQTAKIKKLEKEKADAEAKAKKEAEKQNATSLTTASSGTQGSGQSADVSTSAGEASADPSESSGSGLGSQIAAYGCQFIGNPYVFGGTSLTSGTDCSGFTYSVYKHFGISIPRDSTSQRFSGTGVDYANARPGDLICYAGHVGLYIGNGQIVHASTERTGIKISNATYRTILAVRRIVN